jgi:hypothetical protein
VDTAGAASANAYAGDVTVVCSTGASVTVGSSWQYVTAGSVQTAVPSEGQLGTFVTVTSLDLRGNGSNVVIATLGGVHVSGVVSENDTAVVRSMWSTARSSNSTVVVRAKGAATSIGGSVVITARGRADTGALAVLGNV